MAGSLGPTGQLVEPYGLLTHAAAVEAYAEQARALADGGVDLLVLETFFALRRRSGRSRASRRIASPARRVVQLRPGHAHDDGRERVRRRRGGRAARRRHPRRELRTVARRHEQIVGEFLAAAPHLPLWVKPNAGRAAHGPATRSCTKPVPISSCAARPRAAPRPRRPDRRAALRLDDRARRGDRAGARPRRRVAPRSVCRRAAV